MGLQQDFIDRMEAQLKNCGVEIDDLRVRAAEAGEEVRGRIEKILGDLLERREAVLKRIQEVKRAKDEAWVDLQVHTENALDSLKTGVESALSRFRRPG